MERMSVDSESVIEFGAPEPEENAPGAAGKARRLDYLRDLGSDHRVPVLVAGVGAVAAFASLISEWQTTTVRNIAFADGEPAQAQMFKTNLIDLGGLGAAYLAGLFLIVTAVVLTLFGPPAGRRYSRLTGLSVGGVQLALLVAAVQMLGDRSLLISEFLSVQLSEDAPQVAYGRGIWCALAGVAAALTVLWISEKQPRSRKPAPEQTPEDQTALELTITPATPFASAIAERDQPHRA
jgi:hypothetical protein